MTCQSSFAPSNTILGGYLAHEVWKCTGQHPPLPNQLFFYEFLNLVDPAIWESKECELREDEDALWNALGTGIKEKLAELNIFVDSLSPSNVESIRCLTQLGACDPHHGGKVAISYSEKKIHLHHLPRELCYFLHFLISNVGYLIGEDQLGVSTWRCEALFADLSNEFRCRCRM